MCSNFFGMESTLDKKKNITTNFFFYNLRYFIWNFFFSHVTFFPTHFKGQNKKESWQLVKKQKNYFKVEKCQKNSHKLKIFSLKIQNSKNKNIKGGGSP